MASSENVPDSSTSSGAASPNGEENSNASQASNFECNICLDTAKDAVISLCGHLFCWPCLHQWLETLPNSQVCPVCKAAISKSKVITLYGRGGCQQDPQNKLPPRPAGQRSEPTTGQTFGGYTIENGVSFHSFFGIGASLFGFFPSNFLFGEPRPPTVPGSRDSVEVRGLSNVFLAVAILFILWILFA